jgi:hypothetical protein
VVTETELSARDVLLDDVIRVVGDELIFGLEHGDSMEAVRAARAIRKVRRNYWRHCVSASVRAALHYMATGEVEHQ